MPVLRQVVGDTLRALRLRQRRTLREVSASARVSLGYLSEVERGQKEASSELLAALCEALDVPLSGVLREVSDHVETQELALEALTAPTAVACVKKNRSFHTHSTSLASCASRAPACPGPSTTT